MFHDATAQHQQLWFLEGCFFSEAETTTEAPEPLTPGPLGPLTPPGPLGPLTPPGPILPGLETTTATPAGTCGTL